MGNYVVSAIKYRPQNFDDVVGQKALTSTLIGAIRSGKLAHSYLFCGPRGVGKTTCARIFAKTINCEHIDANGEACNQCDSCVSFNEGRSLNVYEIDAASNNSVQNIRDLIERVQIPPQLGRYKVFIIDEVHMLSSGAFNAFLKTLEEPPSYAIFILATTEKQKIIPTILSRCQIYDFKRIETSDIVYQLKKIATKEGVEYEEDALQVIAEKADGGMRDALSIFDQQVVYTNGHITYAQVIKNLNMLDRSVYFRIFDNLIAHNIPQALFDFNEISLRGFDGRDFIEGLAHHTRNLLMASDERTLSLLQASKRFVDEYRNQAQKCSPKYLYKVLKVCSNCSLNYRESRNKQLLVEITLIEAAQADDESEAHAAGEKHKNKELKKIFGTTPLPQGNKENGAGTGADGNHGTSPAESTDNAGHVGSSQKKSEAPRRVLVIPTIQQPKPKPAASPVNPRTSAEEPIKAKVSPEPPSEDREIDETAFCKAWNEFIVALPSKHNDLAARMKAMKYEINSSGSVRALCENALVVKSMQAIAESLQNYLRAKLNNRNVTVSFIVDESSNSILNPTESFKEAMAKNEFLQELNEFFNFETI